mmetsp:Transcript_19255/g.35954  ORF Transcript_19255/g.35954 Transcript_19255/m.35954 type:complete len:189 (-) Transcript_19255:4-570(-)
MLTKPPRPNPRIPTGTAHTRCDCPATIHTLSTKSFQTASSFGPPRWEDSPLLRVAAADPANTIALLRTEGGFDNKEKEDARKPRDCSSGLDILLATVLFASFSILCPFVLPPPSEHRLLTGGCQVLSHISNAVTATNLPPCVVDVGSMGIRWGRDDIPPPPTRQHGRLAVARPPLRVCARSYTFGPRS